MNVRGSLAGLVNVRGSLVAGVLAAAAGCALPAGTAPGMRDAELRPHPADPSLVELARVEAGGGGRALLVVYPRSACSGSASGVLVDPQGRFLGAIAPGTAALLSIPADVHTLTTFSSVEVTAPPGAWFATDQVAVPALPSGLVLRSSRGNARQCGSGQYFNVTAASKEELERELHESDVRWLEAAHKDEGQAWLDAHRPRLDDILGRRASAPPTTLTRVVIR